MWALSEGSRHFEEKSTVFDALRKITNRLNELGIAYAVAGGLALIGTLSVSRLDLRYTRVGRGRGRICVFS